MSATRLFRIINILLDKQIVSAPFLAEELEVSVRTIYRDIDKLTLAGIPVYTLQGKGGGISLLSNYILNKSLLTKEEQDLMITSLENMPIQMTQQDLLLKLKGLFQKQSQEWLSVDLSSWGYHPEEMRLFDSLKEAILSRRCIHFEYIYHQGKVNRVVKPIKLIFKSKNWYLQAFCTLRNDYRIFKLSRIKKLVVLDEIFQDEFTPPIMDLDTQQVFEECIIKVDKRMSFRVYEEFHEEMMEEHENYFIIKLNMPIDQWLFSYLLSFGSSCEVISPNYLKEEFMKVVKEMNNIYKP